MTRRKQAQAPADTASSQLRRLLLAIPALADDHAHPLAEIASRAGTDEATLLRDLRALVTRGYDEPGGFIEPVQLAVDAESVRLDAPGFFRRPMALSRLELEALELGLATLRQEAPAEDHATIDRARSRLRKVLTHLLAADEERPAYAAEFGSMARDNAATRRTIDRCVAEHRVVELTYHGPEDPQQQLRRVQPLGVVHARGSWFLIAWCLRSDGFRVFRLDRIAGARETDEQFEPPADFQLESVVRDGRVSSGAEHETVTVRYSPRIARWILEREDDGVQRDDGSAEVEYPLLSAEWAVRHVLQYGAEAEVIGPATVRQRVREVLAAFAPAPSRRGAQE